jgi:hypothetical protein
MGNPFEGGEDRVVNGAVPAFPWGTPDDDGGGGDDAGEELPGVAAELGENARKTWVGSLLSAGCVTVGEDPDRPVDPGSEEARKKLLEACDRVFGHDQVEHPAHYNGHPSGVECIQIIEHMNFCLGNVVKYVWRADQKGAPLVDLKKARFYLEREIARREAENPVKQFKPPTNPH